MNRFKLALKFSRLDNSLQGFLKKYKTVQNTNIKTSHKLLEQDTTKSNHLQYQQSQIQQNSVDKLKEKYLLSKAKKIDLNDKDPFSHFNRAQELALEKQIKKVSDQYEQEVEVLKLHQEGEMLIDDSLLPDDFLESLEESRKEGIEQLEQVVEAENPSMIDEGYYKFESLEEWKSFMHFEKPLIDRMMDIQLKKYPGTEKGYFPHQDPEGFTKWIQENHTQEEVEAVENFLQLGYGEQAEKEASDEEDDGGETDNELNEEISEEKWETISPGPALFVQETMFDMVVKGTPIEDLADNINVQIFTAIPQDEVRPLPEKLPLDKEELIDYLERWSFYRSIQGFEFIKDGFEGKFNDVEMEPTKSGSLNTYYQTLPKQVRENPNVKNVYRGLEFANNHMSLAEKEEALNYAAKTSCPFDELNDYIFDKGSSGYKPMVSRFDEERLIQDQESDHVDAAISPEVTRKFLEQRRHVPKHVAEDDVPAPDWVVDKMERVDDLPVDYYINDDGFWDDYIKAKEQKHLSDSPLSGGKKYFRHI